MIEFAPIYQTLLLYGIDLICWKQSGVLPQRVLASWLASLSPGSRNRDETCRMSLWCCSLSGESLHQTPTRWSTEPTHIKQKNSSSADATCVRAGCYVLSVCLTHLDLSQSVLSLPVPDRKDVVVGVIYSTQRVSSILTNRKKTQTPVYVVTKWYKRGREQSKRVSEVAIKLLVRCSYRLGESQADQGSVKEACAQNMECVEADRVPHTDMRSQLLPGENNIHKHGHNSRRGVSPVWCEDECNRKSECVPASQQFLK